jgi:hypothetical protein
MSPKHHHTVLRVAWYDEAQWYLLCSLVPDRGELDNTFEQWQQSALQSVRMLESQGYTVERVYVDALLLSAWCRERNRAVNGEARAEYVAQLRHW